MINFTSRTKYYISSNPTDMRNGREGLAGIVREPMGHNPKCYDEAFIFYSKDYKKVKILHYDLNGNGYLILSSGTEHSKIIFSNNHVSGNARKIGVTFIWWFPIVRFPAY